MKSKVDDLYDQFRNLGFYPRFAEKRKAQLQEQAKDLITSATKEEVVKLEEIING